MTALSNRVIVFGAAVFLTFSPAYGETLESVKKQIHERTSRLKTLSYKSHFVSVMQTPEMTIKSENDQVAQFVRQGDQMFARIEVTSNTTQRFGGQEQKIPSTMLSVSDGQYQYTYSESAGQKSAFRQKLDPAKQVNVFDTHKMFADLEKTFAIKVLPDATVDGRSCFVLEMTPKDPAAISGISKTVSYFDKGDGIIRKSDTYDQDGKATTTSTTTDVKVDAAIPPDRFKFKAPEGVTIQDMPS
ncbi:MAG TPA: outer membrane lipoprotein-sorting protein [Phycisphaerae bacterium]|nr:outer membrane lipoprotein-sorting protein [Phycisphaerae bacterium]